MKLVHQMETAKVCYQLCSKVFSNDEWCSRTYRNHFPSTQKSGFGASSELWQSKISLCRCMVLRVLFGIDLPMLMFSRRYFHFQSSIRLVRRLYVDGTSSKNEDLDELAGALVMGWTLQHVSAVKMLYDYHLKRTNLSSTAEIR
jgi:hypothetical protein